MPNKSAQRVANRCRWFRASGWNTWLSPLGGNRFLDCDEDFNVNGRVEIDEVLDSDGHTDHSDLGIVLTHWGEGCP